MITYIALLRGINVGGHVVKMDRLRGLFGELGLAHVQSYIQTGNIFFRSYESDKPTLRTKIEEHLHNSLGYNVAICLRTVQELEQTMALDPFNGIMVTPNIRLSVTFLARPTELIVPLPYITPDGCYELVGMTRAELFMVWHLKDGRPGNSYGLLRKEMQTEATTRFWHTTAKILSAAQKL